MLMPMVEFNYAFVFSFYFDYAKPTETLACCDSKREKLEVPKAVAFAGTGASA